jgi:hypothetical protein
VAEGAGRRAYRRPLEAAETERLMGAYRAKRARGGDQDAGLRHVVALILQSPWFLYRVEVPPADARPAPLDPFELATRLSYFLWASLPDDRLLDLAQTGALAQAPTLEAEARRLLADGRAVDTLRSFHRQWLEIEKLDGVSKDVKLFPTFAGLRGSMTGEVNRFVEDLFRRGNGSLTTMLTAGYSFLDAALARHYGAPAPATAWARVELPAGQRSGVLTQAAWLSVMSLPTKPSPIHRGKFVRENVLCHEVPPPPPGVETSTAKPDESLPLKQFYEEHRRLPACAACHALMDPIGFGFMHYDAIGRWQTMDGRAPVDATGDISGTRQVDGPYTGAVELGRKLAASREVQRCLARQWLRYGLGRMETEAEACLVDGIFERFARAGLDMRELLIAVVASDLFRHKRAASS